MIESMMIGGGFALAAAAQPGPLQAFLLSRVAAVGWRRTLPAAFAPVFSDGPIACLMLLLLHSVPAGLVTVLRGLGGAVLLLLAARTYREWRRGNQAAQETGGPEPRTLWQAVAVNAINPGPYIGWSLVLGPHVVQLWPEQPQQAVLLIASFYVVIVLSLALLILLLGTTTLLGPGARHLLLLASSLALAGLGIYSIAQSFRLALH